MKKLFSFDWDCGSMGSIDGLFIATQEEVDALVGKEIYFGEVLGKYSEIYGIIEPDEIKVRITDQNVIVALLTVFGNTLCGYNPLDYLEE